MIMQTLKFAGEYLQLFCRMNFTGTTESDSDENAILHLVLRHLLTENKFLKKYTDVLSMHILSYILKKKKTKSNEQSDVCIGSAIKFQPEPLMTNTVSNCHIILTIQIKDVDIQCYKKLNVKRSKNIIEHSGRNYKLDSIFFSETTETSSKLKIESFSTTYRVFVYLESRHKKKHINLKSLHQLLRSESKITYRSLDQWFSNWVPWHTLIQIGLFFFHIIDNLAAEIFPYHCKFPPWFFQELRLLINEKKNSTNHLKYRVIVIIYTSTTCASLSDTIYCNDGTIDISSCNISLSEIFEALVAVIRFPTRFIIYSIYPYQPESSLIYGNLVSFIPFTNQGIILTLLIIIYIQLKYPTKTIRKIT
ncbi:hypothetical protein AGLY_008108 [Aphis glycines]|uniref:Uncharacterized protein n=1 Tax=Aphis glycines TaxID=307491 RepID=A0A6G0TN55_APHGL|nr:hypothetical protein AGLY_008108 [Aphis glycines]